jgi:uncharacterized 2Fe-2S/4Fe-4S cluster protein (DUF4445 family)
MHKLTVMTDTGSRVIPFSPGPSLRELLETAGESIRCGCLGNGACGLCLVQIEEGNVNEPTKNECFLLSSEQLERNVRLACKVVPENDLRVRIIAKAGTSPWQELDPDYLSCAPSVTHLLPETQSVKTGYGLAVDLGTTHISISLWDLGRGNRLYARTGLNPQSRFGSDVVTRLIAACELPENAQKLARLPLEAVRDALSDMSLGNGIDPHDICRVNIVGNTSMLLLLTETDPGIILKPSSWTQPIGCRTDTRPAWASVMGIHPEAEITVVQPLAGFVGSDLLAGVLATGLTREPGGLLIDFGTNSEMALWDGETLWVTSAAGGPAFESFETQCCMPAEPGAIFHVDRQKDSLELRFKVIGNKEAAGVCGSGLVDLIAELLDAGVVTSTGKLSQELRGNFIVQSEQPHIRLTGRDVDMFQRAKAGIGAGIATLLAKAKMNTASLRRICVCGIFGHHLNVSNARKIGLLPDIPLERVRLCGNTSLSGSEHMLLSPARCEELESLRKRATTVNLSQLPEFETLFIENLYLQRTLNK